MFSQHWINFRFVHPTGPEWVTGKTEIFFARCLHTSEPHSKTFFPLRFSKVANLDFGRKSGVRKFPATRFKLQRFILVKNCSWQTTFEIGWVSCLPCTRQIPTLWGIGTHRVYFEIIRRNSYKKEERVTQTEPSHRFFPLMSSSKALFGSVSHLLSLN